VPSVEQLSSHSAKIHRDVVGGVAKPIPVRESSEIMGFEMNLP
jgi:hypothetical protein